MEPKNYDAELISAMLDGNTQPKICEACLQASAALTPREQHEKTKEGAEIICRRWLMRAPLADAGAIAGLAATNVSEWEKSQLKNGDELARQCAMSLSIGGGITDGGYRLQTYFHQSKMLEQLNAPHADSLRKTDSDGDFHQRYLGSIFRRDASGAEFLITWRKGRLDSSG